MPQAMAGRPGWSRNQSPHTSVKVRSYSALRCVAGRSAMLSRPLARRRADAISPRASISHTRSDEVPQSTAMSRGHRGDVVAWIT